MAQVRQAGVVALMLSLTLPALFSGADWAAEWHEGLVSTSALLKSGDYDEALPILKRITRQRVDMVGPGDSAAHIFSIVLTHRALAEAGVGDSQEALWYWHVANALYPSVANSDMSMFGAPGEFLKKNPPRRQDRLDDQLAHAEKISGDVTPPRAKSQRKPKFPEGARQFRIQGALIVEAVITKDGIVTAPRVIEGPQAPTLAYAALEAMKNWRFEPARRNGEPIDVLFYLKVNYKLN